MLTPENAERVDPSDVTGEPLFENSVVFNNPPSTLVYALRQWSLETTTTREGKFRATTTTGDVEELCKIELDLGAAPFSLVRPQ